MASNQKYNFVRLEKGANKTEQYINYSIYLMKMEDFGK